MKKRASTIMYKITREEYQKRKKKREFLKKKGITIRYISPNGYDRPCNIDYSYTYNGVPGGFYISK